MVAKPKVKKEKKPEPVPAQPAPVSTGMNAPTASTGASTSTSVPLIAPPPAPVPHATSPTAPTGSGEEGGGILRGAELENTLKEMQDMGFPRDECMRALRAAYYNPDRAVDYLLNGIPSNLGQDPVPSSSAAGYGAGAATGDDMEDDGGDDGVEDSGANPLAFLQNNPMFDQLRQRLITEPAFFQTFMNQLAQTQPQLHQAISQNPQAFLQLLLGGGAGAGAGDADHDPPGTIRVTPEEKAAIERLAGLGFPKHRAIEAYLACDKNEEWAANYLFENCAMDDNYEEQLVQDESAAEVNIPGAGIGQAPSQPAAQNPPAAQHPPGSGDADNMDVDHPTDDKDENGNDEDEEGGSSL